MIKTTLGALHDSVPALTALMGEKLPIKQAYHTSKLAKRIQRELETFIEQRQKLFVEYGKEDEKNPGMLNVPADKVAEFAPKMAELAALPVEIDLDPLNLENLAAANLSSTFAFALIEAGVLVE